MNIKTHAKATDHSAAASTCVSFVFRTRLGQEGDTSLRILTFTVKLGFLVGFEFWLPA